MTINYHQVSDLFRSVVDAIESEPDPQQRATALRQFKDEAATALVDAYEKCAYDALMAGWDFRDAAEWLGASPTTIRKWAYAWALRRNVTRPFARKDFDVADAIDLTDVWRAALIRKTPTKHP